MRVLAIRLLANAVALAVAAWVLSGISLSGADNTDKAITLLVVAAIFGIVNAIIKPIAVLLSLPLLILTLGLLIFVINALLLLLTEYLTELLPFPTQLTIDGFGTALAGALIISLVSWLLDVVLPEEYER